VGGGVSPFSPPLIGGLMEDKYTKAAGEMFLQIKRKEQETRKKDADRRLKEAVNDAAGYIHAKARGRKYFY
jgi:hypothetical protein